LEFVSNYARGVPLETRAKIRRSSSFYYRQSAERFEKRRFRKWKSRKWAPLIAGRTRPILLAALLCYSPGLHTFCILSSSKLTILELHLVHESFLAPVLLFWPIPHYTKRNEEERISRANDIVIVRPDANRKESQEKDLNRNRGIARVENNSIEEILYILPIIK
jgi:hypothetical protein